MALLWPLQQTDFILLDYMATHPAFKGKKIAAHFLRFMKLYLQETGKHFILEAEDPEAGLNKTERGKRIDFYRKNGARQLKNIRFILPALQGNTATEMILMIFPDYDRGVIGEALVKKLIVQIYKELYNRDEAAALAGSSGYAGKKSIELV